MTNILLTLLAALWLSLVAATWAEAAGETPAGEIPPKEMLIDDNDAAPTEDSPQASVETSLKGPSRQPSQDSSKKESNEDDEYSFNWLDPDKKIYVLQNRKYTKAGKLSISVMGGIGFSNPYYTTLNFDPRIAFYVSETWGIELFYTLTNNSINTTLVALSAASANVVPGTRQIQSQMGAMIHYVPWYAKINVFNSILYFDWYFGLGGASMNTVVSSVGSLNTLTSQNPFGVVVSTGHLYHLSQHLIFRIDLTGTYYNTTVNGPTGSTAWYSNYNFGVGLGWRL